NALRTVTINEATAEGYWANRDPIGARVQIGGDDGGPAEVIGIAKTAKYGGMDEHRIDFLYRSYNQGTETYAAFFVETDGSPEAMTAAVLSEIHGLEPNMPILDVRTMRDHFRENGLAGLRLNAQMLTPLGLVALILGVLGSYGVISYSVG